MGFFEVFLIAVALAMDAFSIALSKGLCARRRSVKDAVKLGAAFGLFQFVMPLAGWALSSIFAGFIEKYSGYISCALLVFVGGKMLIDSVKSTKHPDQNPPNADIDIKSLIILGTATSIDALAVGVTFAFDGISILYTLYYCLIIGVVAAVLSFFGYFIGNRLGSVIGDKGGILGGAVLIVLGINMLF